MANGMEKMKPQDGPPQWQRMICQWGMSEKLGPVTFRHGEPHPFLGREMTQPKDFSEKTAQLIDEEIRSIIQDMEKKAEETLSAHRDQLDVLARELLDRETLSKEEIEELLDLPEREKEKKQVSN